MLLFSGEGRANFQNVFIFCRYKNILVDIDLMVTLMDKGIGPGQRMATVILL